MNTDHTSAAAHSSSAIGDDGTPTTTTTTTDVQKLASLSTAMADLYDFFGWPKPQTGAEKAGKTAIATATPKWNIYRPAWAKWEAQPRDPQE